MCDGRPPRRQAVLVIGGGDGALRASCPTIRRSKSSTLWNRTRCLWMSCRKFFPDNSCGLDDIRVRILLRGRPALSCAGARMSTTDHQRTVPTRWAMRPGCSPRNSTAAATRPCTRMASMVYQHGSPFFDEDEEAAAPCTSAPTVPSRSAASIRRISRPARPGTGCSALQARSITPSRILTPSAWNKRRHQDLVLYHPPAPRRFHAAALCRGPLAGRRGITRTHPYTNAKFEDLKGAPS